MTTRQHLARISLWTVIAAIAWTLVLAAFVAWYFETTRTVVLDIVRAQARMALEKDVLYRRWVTAKGGLYVEISPETPPNPNLAHVPERDITTPSGRRLTLINPAYMTRQVFDFARQVDGPQGHITSLHPRHPENVPDAWERAALAAFRHDSAEHGEVQVMNNRRFYRLIRPFAVDEKCIRCHAAEGYQPGDIRGAISVAIPMDEFEKSMRHQDMLMWIVAALLWLTGVGVIAAAGRQLLIGRRAFEDANRQLTARVEEELAKSRTKDALLLQQARYQTLGELLVNIAHQWRQPLNSIGARIQESAWLIASGEIPREEATRRAEEIMLSLKELSGSIETLRRLCEPVSSSERFLPSEAVRQAISVMTDACAVQGIRLSCSLQEEKSLVGIQADLVQCLLNIFTNARDAITARGCREGAIVVELRLTAEQRQEIRVRDNGGGIDDEVLPIVFDPYVTTKFRAQGVGLGLFVARQIIEQRFGGAIAAGNRGDGAEIVITI
ncbi:ATP-binding protein [Trichlorobacter ammonificans]|uniref:histidine kinase n=1 Tax=Trichlorobacter ammonificans TaxID=2916410 RepID=A0ABN8HN82_9BACT|nr:DUF3365 domain-containing protein [Trichlorobacter ammonificans]CAH2032502.1 putative ATP-binding region ATPase domain protein [Trichlorobacter ammonificans]